MGETKRFDLRTILTVTTGRLLTKTEGPTDNGIGKIYEILGWMTDDSPFTHQLGRFGDECRPWLLRWFPDLAPCSAMTESLDRRIKADQTGGQEGIRMWLAELKMMFPAVRDEYDVPRIPVDDHERKNPIDELVAMCGTNEGVIVVEIPENPAR